MVGEGYHAFLSFHLSATLRCNIRESSFFTFPIEKPNFVNFVESITPRNKETSALSNGVEALTLAIKSDWTKIGNRKRHIILVWTDAETTEFNIKDNSRPSSRDIPTDLNELTDLWENSLVHSKRLILFAPDAFPWSLISEHWANTTHHPAKAGEGLRDVDYKSILSVISSSV